MHRILEIVQNHRHRGRHTSRNIMLLFARLLVGVERSHIVVWSILSPTCGKQFAYACCVFRRRFGFFQFTSLLLCTFERSVQRCHIPIEARVIVCCKLCLRVAKHGFELIVISNNGEATVFVANNCELCVLCKYAQRLSRAHLVHCRRHLRKRSSGCLTYLSLRALCSRNLQCG